MKKVTFTTLALVCAALFFTYCGASRKAAAAKQPTVTYAAQLMPLIESKCSPCHIPAKGGNKEALDNIGNVRANIDEIIRRIQLDPSDAKFMPRKKAPLSKEEIALFKTWKEEGTEKTNP